MALDTAQREWLGSIAGLALVQRAQEKQRSAKDVRMREMAGKVDFAKETIRAEFEIKLKKKRGFGSIQVLEEEGTQVDEYDISDYEKYEMRSEYLSQMSSALAKVEQIAKEMREAMTEKLDQLGNPVLDEQGKPIMVPLYTDEEIAEEVYMPLVRERIMPESMVPGRFSKTQEMIDASDKLYKERLKQYTEETEKDPDFREDVKVFGEKLLDVGERAAKMFPGEGASTAATVLNLAKVGFTTTITLSQVISADEWAGMATQVIDNIGKIAGGIVGAAVGSDIGKQVEQLYGAAVTGPKVAIYLAQDPPDINSAVNAMADGLAATMSQAIPNPNGGQKALITAACGCLRNAGKVVNLKQAVHDGDRNAIIDELAGIANQLLKDASSIASEVGKEKGTVDPKKVEEITSKLSTGLDMLKDGVKLTATIVDGVKQKRITLMMQQIVDDFGSILSKSVSTFAPPDVAKTVGSAYSASTSVGLAAYYMTLKDPDQGNALRALAKGFAGALSMACPDEGTAKKVGGLIEKALVSAGDSVDLAKLIEAEKYEQAVKKMRAIANNVMGAAFGAVELGDSGELDSEEAKKIKGILEEVNNSVGSMGEEIAKVKDALKNQELAAELEAKVMELRGQKAIAELNDSREDMRRMLAQRDESGRVAAESRSIDNLIKEMMRDRMVMELATSLVSGGVGTVAKFVPVLGGADAAVQLAINLIKAAERATELNKWIKNQKDMEKAQSSLSTSAQNFVKNQAEQFSHYAAQAACKLAQMIGEIVKCSGLAAAAGEAVSKTAALAAELEEIAYQFYKKADLEAAWKATRKAWDHPESRKLALLARRQNPTLAKYSLAWAAAVKKDALAMEAVATCGLNELTLSDKGSNVQKVQQYLELMFNEDNVVLKRIVPPNWMPGNIELTVRSWGMAKSRAVKDAELLDEPTGMIDESVALVERQRVEVDTKEREFESAKGPSKNDLVPELQSSREQFIQALQGCQKALSGYTPHVNEKGQRGKVHYEMRDVVRQYFEQAGTQLAEVEAVYETQETLNETISLRKVLN